MTEQQVRSDLDIEPGYRIGRAENPDEYRLEELVSSGGEGTLWQATSPQRNGGRYRWAVKILHAHNFVPGHNETPDNAMERWYRRSRDALNATVQVRQEVPGVEGAIDVFPGPRPHPHGEPGTGRTLYVVSRWIDGVDLTRWLTTQRSFEQVCWVAEQLARIVDGIAGSEVQLVHRDISPANVMISRDGTRLFLIDFTFTVPTRSGSVTVVNNSGYTAPEARNGCGTLASDRYSYGGVISFLLTGVRPSEHAAATDCYDRLVRDGFPADLARHVVLPLAESPADRPTSLRDWAAALAEFDGRRHSDDHHRELDVTVDGFHTTTVTTLTGLGVTRLRLGSGRPRVFVTDTEAPQAPVVIRSATDGGGRAVDFVIAQNESLWFRSGTSWREAGRAVAGAGLVALRGPEGTVTAAVVDPVSDQLSTIEVTGADAPVRRDGGPYARRVFDAAIDHAGGLVIAAADPADELVILTGDDSDRLHLANVRTAAICSNRWGEPVCYAMGRTSELTVFERRYGRWMSIDPIAAPTRFEQIACIGLRGSTVVAAAGPDGLWVTDVATKRVPEWHRLSGEPCHRVALTVGAAWRIQVAALVDGRIELATERFGDGWSMSSLTR
ncbi:serine/threonine protein kinase [Nocardia sp. NPDC057353]|uniref:serine/threonine protein kinase n=1 Tax=Nocardia sp. NPDC057353 TaxID=3346104 RepID=UPI003628DEB1